MKKLRITFSKWSENEDGQIGKAIRVNKRYAGFIRKLDSGYHIWLDGGLLYEYKGCATTEKEANELVKTIIRGGL